MKIYAIWRMHGEHDWVYDCNNAHVIVANNEYEVRDLAIKKAADEGEEVWKNAPIQVFGDYTGSLTEPFILLTDFHAG